MNVKLMLIVLIAALLAGCSAKSKVVGQTGILTESTGIYYTDPNDKQGRLVIVQENALVLILDEDKDYYHVQLAVTELPVLAGNVEKKAVSFDEADMKNASSGLVKDINVYDAPEQNAAIKYSGYSAAVLIDGEEGDYYKCALPGGDSGYIKKNDMQFIVEKAEWTVEMK